MEKIFVLGGDGFCGWPTALHLAESGHEVVILDDLSRRKIDIDLGVQSLTPINTIDRRLSIWNQNKSNKIKLYIVILQMIIIGLLKYYLKKSQIL